jgi:hypothetical protein
VIRCPRRSRSCRRLEKAIEHAARIELQCDLLPEPPHAVQHALRVVELQRAFHDALFQCRLDRLVGRHAVL